MFGTRKMPTGRWNSKPPVAGSPAPPPARRAARARRGSRRSAPRRGPGSARARSPPGRGWRGCRDTARPACGSTRDGGRRSTSAARPRSWSRRRRAAIFFRIFLARGLHRSLPPPPQVERPRRSLQRRGTFFSRPDPPDLLLLRADVDDRCLRRPGRDARSPPWSSAPPPAIAAPNRRSASGSRPRSACSRGAACASPRRSTSSPRT